MTQQLPEKHSEPKKLIEAVEDAATSPMELQVSGMGMSREQRLDHTIQAAKFRPSPSVANRIGGGIRFNKARAGGAL
jgi:hypothetical protein